MTKNDFLALLEEITETDEGTLTGKESLEDLEMWDSLTIVTFIAKIDEELDITLSPEKISEAQTVEDLLKLLEGKITG